jgi:hypothetical protein
MLRRLYYVSWGFFFCLIDTDVTNRRGWVVSTPALYSRGPGLQAQHIPVYCTLTEEEHFKSLPIRHSRSLLCFLWLRNLGAHLMKITEWGSLTTGRCGEHLNLRRYGNEELHNLYFSLNIIRMIKLKRNSFKILIGKRKSMGSDRLAHLGQGERTMSDGSQETRVQGLRRIHLVEVSASD